MTKPLFSIITVTLNNSGGLQKTYSSLHSQTYKDYEWIVIDGASTDSTAAFLDSIPDLSYISEPDNGLYDAMNKGIDCAQGQYLIFMNAGDIFASTETLQTIAETITTKLPDFIYGDALEIFEGKDKYKSSRDIFFIHDGMVTHHQAMIYKKSILGDLKYNLHYKIAADYDFTVRFVAQSQNISYLSTPLCLFESGGVSESNARTGRIEQFKIRRALNISFLKCFKIFMKQTLIHLIRKISPRSYWWLKELATRV